MNKPFSITITDVGPSICDMSHRKAACVRVEVSAPLNLKAKVIDLRRVPDFLRKAIGAVDLMNLSNESRETIADQNETKE